MSRTQSSLNVSASQISPRNIKVGQIIEGKSCMGDVAPQYEIEDYIVRPGYPEREYHTVWLRELPTDERVEPEFITGRLTP